MAVKASVPGLTRTQATTLGIVFFGGIAATIAAGWILSKYRSKSKILEDAHDGFDSGV